MGDRGGQPQAVRHRATRLAPPLQLGLLAVVALGMWAWGWGALSAWTAATWGPVDVARWGELALQERALVFVARREQLLRSPAAGTLDPVAKEGQPVPAGTVVAVVWPEDPTVPPAALAAPFPAVASFLSDGLEGHQWAQQAMALTRPRRLPPERWQQLVDPESRRVAAGQPVVRLVDRTALHAVLWPDAGRLQEAAPGFWRAGQKVELHPGGTTVGNRATVVEVRGTGPDRRVLLQLDRQPAEWMYRRWVGDVRVVLARYSGVVVPASAVVQSSRSTGVWVRTTSGPSWVPIRVLGRVDRLAVVDGLPTGARVYRWPRWLGHR